MNWRSALASLLGVMVSFTPAAGATLEEMVASLQRLQVRETAGDKAAYDAQAPLVRSIGEKLADRDAASEDGRTIATIVYLLNGGAPGGVVRLVREKAFAAKNEMLVKGVLAYTQGHATEAVAAIGDVDPKTLDLRIAAHICFILSVLQQDRGYARSVELLDFARLLAPGGLIEEASIRRETTLAAEAGDSDRLLSLTRQYLARFGQSLFLDKYLLSLMTTLGASRLSTDPRFIDRLDEAIAPLPAARRGDLLLSIARAKLLEGAYPAAEAAAGKALRAVPDDAGKNARGRLYRGVAHALANGLDGSSGDLDAIVGDTLPPQDQLILSLARRLFSDVHAWAATPEAIADPPSDSLSAMYVATIDAGKSLLERTAALGAAERAR